MIGGEEPILYPNLRELIAYFDSPRIISMLFSNDELEDQLLTADEINEYKLNRLEIDRKYYGYDWLPYTPIPASGCLQHLYSLYINI